jgi:hypothetical protein
MKKGPLCSDEARAERKRLRDEENKRRLDFRIAMAEKYSVTGHPKESKLWNLAWEYGHAAGYHEVEMVYAEFAELLTKGVTTLGPRDYGCSQCIGAGCKNWTSCDCDVKVPRE